MSHSMWDDEPVCLDRSSDQSFYSPPLPDYPHNKHNLEATSPGYSEYPPPSHSPFIPILLPSPTCMTQSTHPLSPPQGQADTIVSKPSTSLEATPPGESYCEIDWDMMPMAEAHLKALATGSETAIVKEDLRYKIIRRRKLSGLEDVKIEENTPNNELTARDLERRERRKASNRRAATKCRLKKKASAEQLEQERMTLTAANEELQKEVLTLKQQMEVMQKHIETCPWSDTAITTAGITGNTTATPGRTATCTAIASKTHKRILKEKTAPELKHPIATWTTTVPKSTEPIPSWTQTALETSDARTTWTATAPVSADTVSSSSWTSDLTSLAPLSIVTSHSVSPPLDITSPPPQMESSLNMTSHPVSPSLTENEALLSDIHNFVLDSESQTSDNDLKFPF